MVGRRVGWLRRYRMLFAVRQISSVACSSHRWLVRFVVFRTVLVGGQPPSARKRACYRFIVVCFHVGFASVCWVCYRFVYAVTVKPNAVMLAHGLHSVRYLVVIG